MLRVGQVEDRLLLAERHALVDHVGGHAPPIGLVGVDDDAIARGVDLAMGDVPPQPLQPLILQAEGCLLSEQVGLDRRHVGLQRLDDLGARPLEQPLVHALGFLEGDLALLEGQFIAPDLEWRAVAQFEHVARPLEVAGRPIPVDLAGLDVLADELQVLGIDPIAVLAQGDLGDIQHRLGLLDIRLGLEVADALAPLFFLVGGCVELRDDVPGLDAGTLGARSRRSGSSPASRRHAMPPPPPPRPPPSAAAVRRHRPPPFPWDASVCFLVVSAALGVAGRAGVYCVTM